MPKQGNQKQKLLWIAKILSEETDPEHGMTLSELTERLERVGIFAERKGLYDDLQALCDFGMSVEKKRNGKLTEYFLAERLFELPELKLLVDAVQSAKFLTEKKSRALIEKLSSLTDRHEAKALHREVYLSRRLRSDNEQVYYTVDAIHSAMMQNVKISFTYFEYNSKKKKVYRHGKKLYLVSPWGLLWNDENYYMIAYDSDAAMLKHYRVDKMESPALSSEKRDGEELGRELDLPEYAKELFGMYGGPDTLVTLTVKNSLAGVILDRFGQEPTFFDNGDGSFNVSVHVAVSPQFLGWIMSFGKDIRIVSPASAVEPYLTLAKEILESAG